MKKKVLFIHHWSTVGGSGISLYNTWKSLDDQFNVVAYIPEKPNDLNDFLRSKKLIAKTYPFTCGQIPFYSGGSNYYKPGFWYLIILAFTQINFWKKVIELESPEIIMVNSKVLCWMSPLFKGRKSVCFVRETMEGDSNTLINKIINKFLEQFSLVSFLSEYDLVQTNLQSPLTVVSPDILSPQEYIDRNGKDTACRKLNIESDSFNIAFVGGVDPLKGLDVAIRAMSFLKEENIKLIVAGNYKTIKDRHRVNLLKCYTMKKSIMYFRKIKYLIKKYELENYIEFVGSQNDISLVYSASELLLFPMKKPHQSRPAFEIGVQSKPVIISDFKNIREFIVDDDNGLVFEPNNPKKLAEAIIKLKSNKILLKQMGESNYRYTMQFHTEKYAVGKLLNGIKKIL